MADVPLLKYVERLNGNLEKRLEDKAAEQERALKLALEVQESKFHTFDDFRASIREQMITMKERMDKLEGAGTGVRGLWGFIVVALGLVLSALLLVTKGTP